MTEEYKPAAYWSDRLANEFTLRGVGHTSYSPRYNEWVYRRKANMLMEALKGANAGDSALDIGSGVGWVVDQLLQRGLRVEGCDITDIAVERLSDRFPSSSFFRASVGETPIPREPESFDVVTMLDVAYHITDYGLWEAAVKDIGRLLKPGGILVVTDRLAEHPHREDAHVQFRSRDEWDRAGGAGGMELVRVEPLYTWLCRRAGLRGWQSLPRESRGAIEYFLDEHAGGARPHLRWATLAKSPRERVHTT